MATLDAFPSAVALMRDPVQLEPFAADMVGIGATPLGLARPADTDQVATVVQWANQHGIPIVPFSSKSGPRRRGDTLSHTPAVMLDMSCLDQVIHADGDDRIAVIEPGVTFAQFDAELLPHGLRSFKPLLPRRGKSVLASYLEREPTTSPYDHWDTADPLSSIELVFGNGERFRTGGAATPGTLEENLRRGLRQMVSGGPIATDFTRVLQGAQGNLGVVCWGSVYCERIPPSERAYFVSSDNLVDLTALAYATLKRRTAGQLFIVDRVQLGLLASADEATPALPADLPRWTLYVNLASAPYFPEEHLAYVEADFFADAAQAKLTPPCSSLGELSATRLHYWLQTPLEHDYKQQLYGDYSDFFFLSQLSKAQSFVDAVDRLQSGGGSLPPAGFYLQPMVHGVTCHIEITFPHGPNERQAAQSLRDRVVDACGTAGAFFSRPYAPWGQAAFKADPQAAQTIARIKQLLDPNAVMNPDRFSY